jgi:RHS repeat-associated protein
MTIAAKHLDPIMGIDTHIVMIPTPAGPVPTPLPNPYVGMVFDPLDYVPIIGATVFINGMPRAQAGTGGIALMPHLPLGGPLVPPPTMESEVFMGSSTVAIDGDAQSYLALPVLSCQSIGMPAPFRPKGAPPKSLVLPTSAVLSIPMGPPVFIGGPPTISLMAMGFRAGAALLGKLGPMIRRAQRGAGRAGRAMRALTAKARRAGNALADFLRLGQKGRNRVNRAICTVTGHPVDVATGKVFTEKLDFELPGTIPFKWERVWYSTSTYFGALGHGWHHCYDAALYVHPDVVLYRTPDGRLVSLPPLAEGQEYYDRGEKLTLLRDTGGYAVRTKQRRTFRFRQIGRPNNEHVLSTISDAAGSMMQLAYDERGLLVEILDTAGRAIQLVYDRAGRIVSVSAPHPTEEGRRFAVVQYLYDGQGNLARVVDALGHSATYEYAQHLLVKETNRVGLSFYFAWDGRDEQARCVHTWGDGGIYDHKLAYDSAAGVTEVENSLGHKTTYTHRDGLVVRTVDALGAVTETEYNDFDEVVVETDELGQRAESKYDVRGNLIEKKGASGAAVALSYGPADELASAKDALGGEWFWTHDTHGRLIERKNPLGHSTKFEWQGPRLVALTDPAGLSTFLSYDAAGNLIRLASPDGTSSGWTFDLLGRLRSQVDVGGAQRRQERDLNNRVVRLEEPDGNVKEFTYDAEGSLLQAKDRQYDVTFTYQGIGKTASRSQGGTTVRLEYDTEERLVAVHNEHGAVHRFVLDPNGKIIEEHGFDGFRRRLERDLAGRVTKALRPAGRETKFMYDPAGRVVLVEHDDGSASSFQYRANGEMVFAANASMAVSFERDPVGRIIKETQGPDWVAYEYDPNGYRTSIRSSKGAFQTNRRNVMGEVSAIELAMAAPLDPNLPAAAGFVAEFSRDQRGLELERALPGGVRAKWQRDRLGRPVQQEVFRGNQVVSGKQYSWDINGRVKRVVDALTGPVDYHHDVFGNLLAAVHGSGHVELRMPDAVGNLFRTQQQTDRKYGLSGQLLEAHGPGGITRYEYDAELNLVRKLEPGGEVWEYEWNRSGMLSRVVRPDGHAVEFGYDALGRRVSKKYKAKTTRWIWDNDVPLHEWVEKDLAYRDGVALAPAQTAAAQQVAQAARNATLTARPSQGPPASEELAEAMLGTKASPITWVFEPESVAPLAKLVNGQQFGIVSDHLGTPTAMFDANGSEVWAAAIDSYGDLRDLRGPRQACPFRFPGQYEDAETGLYYNRYRYYDPAAGQYTSSDPIGLLGGLRPFAYVHDPLAAVDPKGLACDIPDAHAQLFDDGASFLIPKSTWEWLIKNRPRAGYDDGLFVTTKKEMDDLIASGDRAALKKRLGIPDDGTAAAWDGPLMRVDVPNPMSQNARMPTGKETGANKMFVPGGRTSGGAPEIVVDPMPIDAAKANSSGPFFNP